MVARIQRVSLVYSAEALFWQSLIGGAARMNMFSISSFETIITPVVGSASPCPLSTLHSTPPPLLLLPLGCRGIGHCGGCEGFIH